MVFLYVFGFYRTRGLDLSVVREIDHIKRLVALRTSRTGTRASRQIR